LNVREREKLSGANRANMATHVPSNRNEPILPSIPSSQHPLMCAVLRVPGSMIAQGPVAMVRWCEVFRDACRRHGRCNRAGQAGGPGFHPIINGIR
jgi:hypothetical protein